MQSRRLAQEERRISWGPSWRRWRWNLGKSRSIAAWWGRTRGKRRGRRQRTEHPCNRKFRQNSAICESSFTRWKTKRMQSLRKRKLLWYLSWGCGLSSLLQWRRCGSHDMCDIWVEFFTKSPSWYFCDIHNCEMFFAPHVTLGMISKIWIVSPVLEKARHLSFVATKTKQTLLKHAFALTMQNFIRNYEFMQNYCYCTIFLERNKLVVPKTLSFIYCTQVQLLSFIVRLNDTHINWLLWYGYTLNVLAKSTWSWRSWIHVPDVVVVIVVWSFCIRKLHFEDNVLKRSTLSIAMTTVSCNSVACLGVHMCHTGTLWSDIDIVVNLWSISGSIIPCDIKTVQ